MSPYKPPQKRCSVCGIYKQHDAYNKNSSKSDGLSSDCTKCNRLQNDIRALRNDKLDERITKARRYLDRLLKLKAGRTPRSIAKDEQLEMRPDLKRAKDRGDHGLTSLEWDNIK